MLNKIALNPMNFQDCVSLVVLCLLLHVCLRIFTFLSFHSESRSRLLDFQTDIIRMCLRHNRERLKLFSLLLFDSIVFTSRKVTNKTLKLEVTNEKPTVNESYSHLAPETFYTVRLLFNLIFPRRVASVI